jgi:hypothetical protein
MPYLRKLDTASLSNRINLKVNITDTAVMLTPYLRKLDTASLSNRINNAGLPTTGNSTGNMLYWNGSAWVRITPGSVGQILKVSAGGIPVWGNADFYCGLTTLSDIDNNTYNTVQIGSQCWMSENLRVRKYIDGTNIPHLIIQEDYQEMLRIRGGPVLNIQFMHMIVWEAHLSLKFMVFYTIGMLLALIMEEIYVQPAGMFQQMQNGQR